MPLTYRIDHEHRRVLARAGTILSDDDLFAFQREVWSRRDVVGYDQILDMSAVERIDAPVPSADSMRKLAALAAGMDDPGTRSRFAIVAPGDLAFGMGRMYATYRALEPRSTREVRVFRNEEDATAWLDEPGDATHK